MADSRRPLLAELIRKWLVLDDREPRPPSPLLRKPWREMSWGQNTRTLQYVQEYEPENQDVKHVRILLYGPVGAGKSSFINSVSSTVRRRMAVPALASAKLSEKSFTKKYETHKIKKSRGASKTFYPFVFNDIMGLEQDADCGVRAEDIKLAMSGHVKDGYKFNPVSSLSSSDQGYNPSPSADDKVHVLVCVLSANSTDIDTSVLQKMADIREAASDLGIPQMGVITNIDAACPETEQNLHNVYTSKHLQKKMKVISLALGIPLNCIFPVKNYSHEIELNDDVDTLILSALKNMIDFGDDFIDNL
uniref:interferon-induced protein 44-like isoform X2 n=1 Tax=Scatophagus argus TaxID=75038 RepID=UPI001ED860E9|nr:interferon-induced protein 44-like isoform X2 [Scatophagus argus]